MTCISYRSAAVVMTMAAGCLAGCSPKYGLSADNGGEQAATVSVSATDTSCDLSAQSADTGVSTFVITNNGSRVTEFYVYGAGERVMGEVENVAPGLNRTLHVQFTEAGVYQTACKPGMVGDGIRHDFRVTGQSVQINTEGKFNDAASSYRRYVNDQTGALIPATTEFVNTIKRGDIESAKKQFPLARTYFERIEPVAETFPRDLDPRIDLREADVEPGQKWTGFHRLEKDLWATGLQPDTNAIGDQLIADVNELDYSVKSADWTTNPTQIAGSAQTLLDEISRTKITGEEDIFSHTDLWDFSANVQGSQTAVASVRPILDERNPDLGKRVDQRFAEVEALLRKLRAGDGFVSYDTVSEPQRQELSHAIDALSKEVSEVQGVIARR